MARAVENQMAILHVNSGDGGADGGSHGHSRIIDQRGTILAEASSGVGEVIRATVHPSESSNGHARRGADSPALRAFWAEGLRVLREQNPEFFK
jgi:predicted amidohydrolase